MKLIILPIIMLSILGSNCLRLKAKNTFFIKAVEEIVKRLVNGKDSDPKLNQSCFKIYKGWVNHSNNGVKQFAKSLGKMNQENCCNDARQMASKSAGTLRAAQVAETLYAAGCTRKGLFKDALSTIKDQFKDITSDTWGTVLSIVDKFAV